MQNSKEIKILEKTFEFILTKEIFLQILPKVDEFVVYCCEISMTFIKIYYILSNFIKSHNFLFNSVKD
jgi:hypothetical protein